jgi:hypothetical protein
MRSLTDLDAWWCELLESGTITGSDPDHPNCARTGDYEEKIDDGSSEHPRFVKRFGLLSAARLAVPHLRHHTNSGAFSNYLKGQGCIVREKIRVMRKSGWEFPSLGKCRADWEQRFPSTIWREPDLDDWRAEDADDVAEITTFFPRKPPPGRF